MIAVPITEFMVPLMTELEASLAGIATVLAALLAAVFAIAGSVKLLAPAQTATEFEKLGVPFPVAAARVVPGIELALVPLLLVAPRVGGTAAVVVLGAFTVAVARAVRVGVDVSCGCFGTVSREPVSWATVARNLALVGMAVGALPASSPVVPDLPSTMTATVLALVAAVAVQLVALHQRIGRMWSVALAGELGPEPGLGPETQSDPIRR